MNRILFAISFLGMIGACTGQKKATTIQETKTLLKPGIALQGNWTLASAFSDEFNTTSLDTEKWENDVNSWGTWNWDPANAYTKDGSLMIRMKYDPRKRDNQQYFLTSGIIKSKQDITYGYFEARIKAAHILPGTCPAFWMKGDGPNKQSSEVDFMELRESNPIKQIATNLHAHIDTGSGKPVWIRENRNFNAPWDPRDDFHIYGCHTTRDSIVWYIDNIPVTRAANKYWHFPMTLILSMGVRTPYRTFQKPNPEYPEGQKNWPNEEATLRDKDKFPTEMIVDWVRVWEQRKVNE